MHNILLLFRSGCIKCYRFTHGAFTDIFRSPGLMKMPMLKSTMMKTDLKQSFWLAGSRLKFMWVMDFESWILKRIFWLADSTAVSQSESVLKI